jgi:hypothetical protein
VKKDQLAQLWLHLINSLSHADHIGDACNYVREFADELKLPMPPEDLDVELWAQWTESQGLHPDDSGIYSDAFEAEAARF